VWFVGQTGDYIAVLDSKGGMFEQYPLDPGTGPHNLIVDKQGLVWYAGNRAAHIGKLNPMTSHITKYAMPNSSAGDPHTLVFGKPNEIWFTVQQGNYVGRLAMDTGSVLLSPLLTQNARPYGIVVDASHKPWFTEFGTNKLGTIDSTTNSVKEISLPRTEARPRRLAITSDNAVWYVDYAEGYLGKIIPTTLEVEEWRVPGGEDARPYGMTVDDKDRVWFVETGLHPNRLVGFDTNAKHVISITNIKSGGGTVRHMVYHQPTQTIWFGTDANTIGRATLP
jgi:virginiamycin B lyase